jgi:hypothetical protein
MLSRKSPKLECVRLDEYFCYNRVHKRHWFEKGVIVAANLLKTSSHVQTHQVKQVAMSDDRTTDNIESHVRMHERLLKSAVVQHGRCGQ